MTPGGSINISLSSYNAILYRPISNKNLILQHETFHAVFFFPGDPAGL
jgi:hypothetical protein